MRCPNCGEEIWGEGGVCEVCGATLPQRSGRGKGRGGERAPAQKEKGGWRQVLTPLPRSNGRGARPQAAPRQERRPPPPPSPERKASTLGDLFGRSGPKPAGRDDDGPAMPRFGPEKGPPTPRRGPPTPSGGGWRVAADPERRGARPRPATTYQDDDAAYPDEDAPPPPRRRGFEEPDAPLEREKPAARSRPRWSAGPLQQLRRQFNEDLDREDDEPPAGRRRPGDSMRERLRRLAVSRPLGFSRSRAADAWPEDPDGAHGYAPVDDGPPPGPRRGPPTPRGPERDQHWQAPSPGAGWDFGAAPQSYASAPPMRAGPTPMGGAWPSMPVDQAQLAGDIPSEIDPDYRDTGRGWSVASRPLRDEAPPYAQPMTNGPRRTGGMALAQVGTALFGSMARTTFNLTLLAVILGILAIPVSIGLGRLAALNPSAPAVAAAKTPHPVATPYAGATTYKTSHFSISYPNGWTQSTLARSVSPGGSEQETDFTAPDKTTIFAVGTLGVVPSDENRPTLQAAASAFPSGNTANYITIGAPAVGKMVDGQATVEIDFTCDYVAPGQHLVNLQGIVLLRSQGLTTYVVGFVAPRSQFATQQAQVFNPMLASLRLDG